MLGTASIADRFTELLQVDLEPVGVRLFGRDEDVPLSIKDFEPEAALKSYCQGLTRAARGEVFYSGPASLGCSLGTSILGLEEDPEPLLEDSALEKYGAGLFETEEASRASVDGASRFGAGANKAVLISPLARMPLEPQVVIFEVDPQRAMWLLYGANYRRGGRQALPQSGGVAGGCADVTVRPWFEQHMNVTFLGLGCRLKSAIPATNLLVGLPWSMAGDVIGHLDKMSGPMAKMARIGSGQ